MRRLMVLTLLLSFAVSCGREMASSNSLKQLGLGLQNSHDTFPTAAAAHQGGEQPADDSTVQQPTAGRKIIYRASIQLHVKAFAEADQKISALVSDSGGYVSQFSEDRNFGNQRGGRWTIRVPVTKFNWFLDQVVQLGVAERREVQSQDVTEEYVDLDSRLKNKQTLESRLLELVAKRSDEIKDVLALENELSRVREEIEKMQGRLRYLSDRVTLTMVEISAYERLEYQPPQATFAQRIGSTFSLSLDHLRQFAQAIILAITALVPWVVAALIVVLPIAMVVQRSRRRAVTSTVTV